MLSDPIVVNASSGIHNAASFSLIRTDGYGSERLDTTDNRNALVIQHSIGKNGKRHYVKITYTTTAEDPVTGKLSPVVATVSLSIAQPPFGADASKMKGLYHLLVDTIASNDVGGIEEILGMQS